MYLTSFSFGFLLCYFVIWEQKKQNKKQKRRSISIPPVVALTEFFLAYAETNVHPIRVYCILVLVSYRIINLLVRMWCLYYTRLQTPSARVAGLLFKVLSLNVAMLTMLLNLSNLGLGSGFYERWDQGSNFNRKRLFFTRIKGFICLCLPLDRT